MSLKLKSTKENVFDMPWTGEGPQPWPKDYRRVAKPYGFTTKKAMKAEILFVLRNNLETD